MKHSVTYCKYFPKTDSSDVLLFSFYLKKNKLVAAKDIDQRIIAKFLQCFIYLEFLPIDIIFIKPNEKFGTRNTGKVINITKDEFIIVSKAWNEEYKTLPNTKYISREHWGIRWTGIGRTIAKITFIKTSFKEMNKKAGKEIER